VVVRDSATGLIFPRSHESAWAWKCICEHVLFKFDPPPKALGDGRSRRRQEDLCSPSPMRAPSAELWAPQRDFNHPRDAGFAIAARSDRPNGTKSCQPRRGATTKVRFPSGDTKGERTGPLNVPTERLRRKFQWPYPRRVLKRGNLRLAPRGPGSDRGLAARLQRRSATLGPCRPDPERSAHPIRGDRLRDPDQLRRSPAIDTPTATT
jgi:hypothetical protein